MQKLMSGLSFAAVLLFTAMGAEAASEASKAPTQVEGATLVSPAEAKTLWDREVKFIDVRALAGFEQGRIAGAIHLDYIADFNQEGLRKVAKISDEIVIYCSGPT